MLDAGLACVYDRTGAVYGGCQRKFILAKKRAKAQRLGMWECKHVLKPMDFKKKYKLEAEDEWKEC